MREGDTADADEPVIRRSNSVLIYDGQCGLCVWSVRWLDAHTRLRSATPVASQDLSDDDLVALSLTRADVDGAAWWVEGEMRLGGHLAVARALSGCAGVYGLLGRAMARRPLRTVARVLYPVVVRHRHRLRVAGVRCRVPK